MIELACGFCADAEIASRVPFLPFWALLFLGWCCLWGYYARRGVRHTGERTVLRPGRYLLAAIVVGVVTAPLTLGSLLAPMIIILPIWLLGLFFRRPADDDQATLAHTEARVGRIVLTCCLIAVPFSYIVLLIRSSF